MKCPALLSAALLAFAAISTPVNAQLLQYTLSGTDLDGTIEFASFQLDANPVPLTNNVGPGEGFRLKFISGTFQYGSIVSNLQDILFNNAAIGGGLFNLDPADSVGTTAFLNVTGPQLYSGAEASPRLLTGNFTVFDAYSGAALALDVAEVPEPATWAMMVGGFGMIGFAARQRRGMGAAVSTI